MKTSIIVLLAAGMTILLVYMPVCAQQYGGYYPGYQSAPTDVPYGAPPPNYVNGPLYWRLQPRPRVYQQWNYYNRGLDRELMMRSPIDQELNPESDLQYMLRTF